MSSYPYKFYTNERYNINNTIEKQKILYLSIGMIVLFITILYSVDYMIGLLKPEFIKINGKIDRNRHFSYTVGISLIIYFIIVFALYQFFA